MASKTLRVLMVEDSPDDALLLLRDLRRGGYDVLSERVDTPEAMAAALDGREWDVVISDYVMPRFSAPDALALLNERGLDLPFIILSGAVGEQTAVEVMRAGAHDFLLKGSTARLCPAIEREMHEAANRRERRAAEAERERLLTQLEAERSRLEAVLEYLPVGVVIAESPAGRIVRGNARMERIWQRSADSSEDMAEAFRAAGFHADGRELRPEEWPLARSIRSGDVITDEEVGFLRADGTRGTMSVSSAPIRGARAEILAGVATFTDITERKQEEEAQRFLAEAGALLAGSLDYETTLASIARLAVPTLADWCIIDMEGDNDTITRVAVAHNDPGKEKLVTDLNIGIPPDRSVRAGVFRVLETGRSQFLPEITDAVLVAITSDPEQIAILHGLGLVSGMCVPLRARGRTLGAISLFSAESGRRFSRRDLAFAEEVARRAAVAVDNARLYRQSQEALRARDEFLSTISHDLKTPLTAIKGMAQLLARRAGRLDGPDAVKIVEGLAGIDASATKMTVLIGDLLDVTRLQSGRPLDLQRQATDLVALLRSVIAEVQQTTDRHSIAVEAAVPELIGIWDGPRLERVIANLLSNAIKYSPAGGAITVSAALGDGDACGWALFSVHDGGVGIPAEDLPRVFERFHRGANVAGRIEGTGIGLSGARQIVEQHGGTITVESDEGAGTTFTVALPLEAAIDAD